jgi:hypothetical protein
LSEQVRHADRPTAEESIDIAAAPHRVWPLVSDIGFFVGISPELVAVEWSTGHGDRPYAGRQFIGTNSNQYFGTWQTTATVTRCDEGQVFAWTVGDLDEPNSSWRFTLTPAGAGTRLTQWVQLGTGPSGLAIAIARMPDKEERIIANRVRELGAAMRANLEAIKQRAEAG